MPHVGGKVEVVDTQVDEDPAVGRARRTNAVQIDREHRLVAHQTRQRPDDRVESLGVPDEEERRTPSRQCSERLGFVSGRAQRFFDENVPTRCQCPRDRRRMRRGGCGDDHDVRSQDCLFLASKRHGIVGDGHVETHIVGAGDFESLGKGSEHPHVPQTHRAQTHEGRPVPPPRTTHSS